MRDMPIERATSARAGPTTSVPTVRTTAAARLRRRATRFRNRPCTKWRTPPPAPYVHESVCWSHGSAGPTPGRTGYMRGGDSAAAAAEQPCTTHTIGADLPGGGTAESPSGTPPTTTLLASFAHVSTADTATTVVRMLPLRTPCRRGAYRSAQRCAWRAVGHWHARRLLAARSCTAHAEVRGYLRHRTGMHEAVPPGVQRDQFRARPAALRAAQKVGPAESGTRGHGPIVPGYHEMEQRRGAPACRWQGGQCGHRGGGRSRMRPLAPPVGSWAPYGGSIGPPARRDRAVARIEAVVRNGCRGAGGHRVGDRHRLHGRGRAQVLQDRDVDPR